MAKKVYLNFPITMIPPIYNDEDAERAIDNIISYGIALYIERNKVSREMAGKQLGITIGPGDKELTEAYDCFRGSTRVMTSIDKDKAFDFRDAKKSYTNNRDEIMSLCGELAIRSIIGIREYSRCTREFVLSRMSGIAESVGKDSYQDAVQKFAGPGGKRQWRKLIQSLKVKGCAFYTPKGCHGFFASFKLSPLELAELVERKIRSQKRRTEYDLSNDELRDMVSARIEGSVPH